MPDLPFVGVTAVVAGMAAFNRDAAQVETSLIRIGRASDQLERQTGGAFGGLGSQFENMASALATGATVITGALVLAGAASIKFAADFEQQLAIVQAITGATDPQIAQLGDTITDLARRGTVGFSDLAEGATELVRSGRTIEEAMGGALEGVQQLTIASGGEIGLKAAADLVAGSMNAFGLTVKDVNLITTAATVVAQNSTATFTGFGQAVAIAAGSAHQAGFTIKDFAAVIAILTKDGTSASVAATALRGVVQRLILPSKQAQEVMDKYGISLFDAAGHANGARTVIGQLNAAFSDEQIQLGKITEEERLQALATIGLQRTNNALFKLVTAGTDEFDRLIDSFETLRAVDLAQVVMAPLNSQMEIAFNNVLALANAFGQTFLQPLRDVTVELVRFLQSISTNQMKAFGQQVVDAFKAVISGIGGAISTFSQFLTGMGLVTTAGDFLKTTLIGLGVVILAVLIPPVIAFVAAWGIFITAVGIAGTIIATTSGAIDDAANALALWLTRFGPIGDVAGDVLRVMGGAVVAFGQLLKGDFVGAAQTANTEFGSFTKAIQRDGGEALDFIGKKLDETGAAWGPWAAQAGPAGVVVGQSLVGVHQVVEALAFLLQGNFKAAGADAELALKSFGRAAEPLVTLIRDALAGAFKFITETAWPAMVAAADSVGKAIETVGTFFQTLGDRVKERGVYDDLKKAWDDLRDSGKRLGDLFSDLGSAVNAVVTPFREAANQAGVLRSNLEPVGATAEATSGFIKFLSLELELASAEFNAIVNAAANMVAFWSEVVRAAVDVIQVVTNMLGVSDDLRGAWANLQIAGQQLGFAFQNLSLFVGDLFGPINEATGGANLLGVAATFLGGAIGGVLGLAIKGVSLIILGLTEVIKEAAQGIDKVSEVVRNSQLAFIGWKDAIGTAISAVSGVVADAVKSIIDGLTSLIPQASNVAGLIADAIIGGLSGGLIGAAGRVASAAASVVTQALDSARNAIGAHSPSTDFILLGEDMGEGLDLGLLSKIPKIKETVRTYGDTILQELADTTRNIDIASRDIGDKLEEIARKAGTSIAAAIDKMNHDIQSSIDQTQDALNRLHGVEADPTSFEAREHALEESIRKRKDAYREQREDEEAASKLTRDLVAADVAYKKALGQENLKFEQQLSDAKKDIDKKRIQDEHADHLAQIELRHKDDAQAIKDRAAVASKDRQERRAADQAERDFNTEQDALITKLKEQNLIQERDAKIGLIQQAEAASVTAIQKGADDQRQVLLVSYQHRVEDLRDKLLDKIPPLTGAASDTLMAFLDAVAQETDAVTQQIVESMGQTVTDSVDAVGADADHVLGRGGIVPTAAGITTAAFHTTTGSADDLRGDSDSGMLGAKDSATQISFVLQQLDDKMPHLVAGIHDLVDAINQLHDKDITITTHHVDTYSSSGPGHTTAATSAGNALSQALANPGASGPGGVFDAARVADSGAKLLQLGDGGVVPGPWGVPMLAIVHGGEFVAGLHSDITRWARGMGNNQTNIKREYNYNVEASYSQSQSPASVEMDIRAMIAMARG